MEQPENHPAPKDVPNDFRSEADDFSTTQWSVVLDAGLTDDQASAVALEKLFVRYWSPVRGYINRQMANRQETEDLTQIFFAQMLNSETLKKVDRRKGKFRTFLLEALKVFVKDAGKKYNASYQTDHGQVISLNEVTAAEMEQQQSPEALSPEKLFDQRWALAILEATLKLLEEEYDADKKTELYERLSPGLTGKPDQGWYTVLAGEMEMSEGAIRVALHRLRRRFGELLRKEVGRTVADPAEVDDEIRHLFSVIEAGD